MVLIIWRRAIVLKRPKAAGRSQQKICLAEEPPPALLPQPILICIGRSSKNDPEACLLWSTIFAIRAPSFPCSARAQRAAKLGLLVIIMAVLHCLREVLPAAPGGKAKCLQAEERARARAVCTVVPLSVCDPAFPGGRAVDGREAGSSAASAVNSASEVAVPMCVPCSAVFGLCSSVSVRRYGPLGGCVVGRCCWKSDGLIDS